MKRTVSLILAVILLSCALFTSCGSERDENGVLKGMKLISAESASYKFYVPTTWQADVASGATIAHYSMTDTSSISVMVFTLENSDSNVYDWWKSFLSDFNNVYEDFELISEDKEATLDGAPASKFVFKGALTHKDDETGKEYKEVFKFMQVAAVKSKALSAPEVYVITYTSSPEVYDDHIEEVNKMVEEFKFN